ncbi:MAG: NAD-dependent epimerase/dehydratase family protein [Gemmatimonadales bacterium]
MRVSLSGATGFVGSHLVDALLEQGHEVTALVRSPARARALDTRVTLVPGDLDDPQALRDVCAGQDVVFHVAGLTAARSESEFLRVNREGTARLLEAAATEAVGRFVLVSSLAAAGPSRVGEPRAGGETPAPVTAYGRSKLAAEAVVREGPIPWTILRPPTVYGPRDREVLRVFQAVKLGIAPVFGRGTQELSAVYGPDLAAALVAAAGAETAAGRTYHPAHPEVFTSTDMVRAIARAMDTPVRLVPLPGGLARGLLALTGGYARLRNRATILNPDKANEFLAAAWTCDPTPLIRDTGWQPAHDLERGVAATLAWYRENKWL